MVTLGTKTIAALWDSQARGGNVPFWGRSVTSVLLGYTGGVLTIEYPQPKITDTRGPCRNRLSRNVRVSRLSITGRLQRSSRDSSS